jgi:serologically defined colon cancer antigen 8
MIRERTDAFERVASELKRYQAELVNRETSWNKVFNNKPKVRMLNALERKLKMDQILASVASAPRLSTLPPIEKKGDRDRVPSPA